MWIVNTIIWLVTAPSIISYAVLVWNSHWPPLSAKSLGLVGFVVLSGLVATIQTTTSEVQSCLMGNLLITWPISNMLIVICVRLYRFHAILNRHTTKMWRARYQVLFLNVVWSAWLWGEGVKAALFGFEVLTAPCQFTPYPEDDDPNYFWKALYLFMGWEYLLGFVLCSLGSIVYYGYRLRQVRAQFNERRQTAVLVFSVLYAYLYVVGWGGSLSEDDGVLNFLSYYFSWVIVPQLAYWLLMGGAVYHFITGDEEYLYKYTYGFQSVPTPEELELSLADRLDLPEVRDRFAKFADIRFAAENLQFYEACKELDGVIGYNERQAMAMEMIEIFIRPGAEKDINISSHIRKEILNNPDLANPSLFEKAKKQILAIMETDLDDGFLETADWKKLVKEAQRQQELLEMLSKVSLVPEAAKAIALSPKPSLEFTALNSGSPDPPASLPGLPGAVLPK